MNSFISWSGGKDCMYALNLFLKNRTNSVTCLLNMCSADGEKSGSHGLSRQLINRQAEAMRIPLVQRPVEEGNYEFSFKKAIAELKEQGVNSAVFGDIYLQEHRDWLERVCREADITPIFPLWKKNSGELMESFITDGFKAIIVAVRKEKIDATFLGKLLDQTLLNTFTDIPGFDPCGENGEYHTFVFDGPLFSHPVSFSEKKRYEDDKSRFLKIE